MRTPVSSLAAVSPCSPDVSAAASPTTPGGRLYWSTLPIDCLYCDGRLKDTGVLTPAGGIRCGKCSGLHYVLLCAGVSMAYVAKVSSADLHRYQRDGFTAQAILAELGAPMRPASARRSRAA